MGAAAPMGPVNLRAIRNGVDDDVVWGHRIGLIEQYFKCSEIDPRVYRAKRSTESAKGD